MEPGNPRNAAALLMNTIWRSLGHGAGAATLLSSSVQVPSMNFAAYADE